MRRVSPLYVLAAAFVGMTGCEAEGSPEYRSECVLDSDCTMMPAADWCADCAEDYVPVNVDEVEAILTDAQNVEYCPIWSEWDASTCAARPSSAPVCSNGVCTETTDGAACAPAGQGMCQGSEPVLDDGAP